MEDYKESKDGDQDRSGSWKDSESQGDSNKGDFQVHKVDQEVPKVELDKVQEEVPKTKQEKAKLSEKLSKIEISDEKTPKFVAKVQESDEKVPKSKENNLKLGDKSYESNNQDKPSSNPGSATKPPLKKRPSDQKDSPLLQNHPYKHHRQDEIKQTFLSKFEMPPPESQPLFQNRLLLSSSEPNSGSPASHPLKIKYGHFLLKLKMKMNSL